MNTAASRTKPCAGAELVNILLGLWVVVSPFVLGFSRNTAGMWSNVFVGIALVLVALAGGWVDEVFQSLVVPLGVWLFFSPLFLGFSSLAFLANNIGLTFAVITAAAISEALRSPASAVISPP